MFTFPLIGVVAPSQAHDRDGERPLSATQFIALAWVLDFVMSLVSLQPVIVPPSGAPWLVPVILVPAAAVCAIGIRVSRRARRAQVQSQDEG